MSNRVKWWVGSVAVVAAIIVACIHYYRTIQEPYWDDSRKAIREALERTDLAKAERAEPSVVDEPYMIVHGQDAQANEMIVWVGEDDVHAEYVDDGRSRRQIERELQTELPEAVMKRIVPGYWNGEYVWEVFYRLTAEGATRHYYRYYRFRDGELLTTYTMSKE